MSFPSRETPAIREVVEVVRRHPRGVRVSAVAKTLGIEPNAASQRLAGAEKLGLVSRVGLSKRAHWLPVPLPVRAPEPVAAPEPEVAPALPDDPVLVYTEQLLDALEVPSGMPVLMRLAYALGRLTKGSP